MQVQLRFWLLLGLMWSGGIAADSKTELKTIVVQGKVICIPEEAHRLHGIELPPNHEHLYAIQTKEGIDYPVLRTRFSEAIYRDDRVRARELIVKARLLPGSRSLDVERLRVFKDNVVNDLYYYCNICSISMVAPTVCECCQETPVLVEKPLKSKD